MDFTEKPVKLSCVHHGRILNVRDDEISLPGGKGARREFVEHGGGACVLALTSEREVLMVRQYRYPCGTHLWELPAGKLDAGEAPEVCARRELWEETGARAGIFLPMGFIFPSPGYSSEKLFIYYAAELTFESQHLDQDEFLELRRVPLEELLGMAVSGELDDAKSLAGLMRFMEMERRGLLRA